MKQLARRFLKEKVTPKAYFLSSPIASKHSTFPLDLTDDLAFEVLALLKKFVSKERLPF